MDNNVVQDLKVIGLNEYEARTYAALSNHGPLPVSSISSYTKIPQSKLYEILNSLQTKTLIESWDSRPKRYKAADLSGIIAKILEEKKQNIVEMERLAESILSRMRSVEMKPSELWTSSGKESYVQKAFEMLRRTQGFAYSTSSSFTRNPALDSEVIKAIKRGVKMKILGTDQLKNEIEKAKALWYFKNGVEVRILPVEEKPSFGLRDDEEVCIRIDSEESTDLIWSNNPSLISITKSYFESLWGKATPLEQFLNVPLTANV